ncbi:DUF402 domain-containing protein [Streptomyces sp. NPDC017638]|uniref:DUF402 domain-containing protein n=1 Tax=Streptomyces sp. NPDC017638 TaxID=3365004 RepID=UPI0037B7CC63
MSANSAEVPARLEVVLVKAGRTKIRYPAELLRDDGERIVVRASWAGSGVRDFGFVRFEPGDVFTEYYWRGRWYAVKEVRAADGSVKGWYCDVTRPAVLAPFRSNADTAAGAKLVVEDLDLDLWRSADGREVRRLDEDEFAASGLAGTDPRAAAAAVAALDELESLALRPGGFAELLA